MNNWMLKFLITSITVWNYNNQYIDSHYCCNLENTKFIDYLVDNNINLSNTMSIEDCIDLLMEHYYEFNRKRHYESNS